MITGYQVSNFLVIRIYELDRVGEVMQATIDAGGNNFESLTFRVDDDQEFIEEARVRYGRRYGKSGNPCGYS